jgi:hypothetical protein
MHTERRLVLSLLTACLASPAAAVPITPSDFDGGQSVESFEGITVGPNVGASPYASIMLPGTAYAFVFASGVTLSSPVPNPGLFADGPFVHDTAIAGPTNNWGANGAVNDPTDVPDAWSIPSSSYFGAFDDAGVAPVAFTLVFASDMRRVGAYVAGAAGTTIQLAAYDAGGALLEVMSLPAPSVASWGSAGSFLGLQRIEGIRRVVFSGVDFGIDGLAFEAVPEPASAVLLGLGLPLLPWLRSHRPIP